MNHLEDYFDTLDSLPAELQRNSTLWKEVDGSWFENLDTHDSTLDAFLSTNQEEKNTQDRLSTLRELSQCVGEYSKQDAKKLALAVRLADTVDRHIQRLEYHFLGFQEELAGDKALKETNKEASRDRKDAKKGNSVNARLQQSSTGARHTRKDEDSLDQGVKRQELGIDPNEPTYCYCNQISFGEMIACDNDNCELEWFHYQCVGLKDPPKGAWYCKECQAKMKKQKR
ncbi:hypothetical protein K493DRAFT_411962 [Basidiobolus meristosporus CBS 931.73]|uniref:Chromatin modification-related protein n=1 Tax=Basidiobolus meristosporus CBS 931.73 TaxID=1314790 RepID=A0A1Y1X7U5_9FUNG|nr:hypothetical protein K493DRAFT_411962 [Basidiobolus meristosporus CBS 931.73]|eukprot:ORX81456.1 hypothetical protein K493DRAFT_411962 [Basidiobolus meristosporus CBS 931.73]